MSLFLQTGCTLWVFTCSALPAGCFISPWAFPPQQFLFYHMTSFSTKNRKKKICIIVNEYALFCRKIDHEDVHAPFLNSSLQSFDHSVRNSFCVLIYDEHVYFWIAPPAMMMAMDLTFLWIHPSSQNFLYTIIAHQNLYNPCKSSKTERSISFPIQSMIFFFNLT